MNPDKFLLAPKNKNHEVYELIALFEGNRRESVGFYNTFESAENIRNVLQRLGEFSKFHGIDWEIRVRIVWD